jgi:hypothetical protein
MQVYSLCPGARKIGHALTGATGTLLFYSLLPDKKIQVNLEFFIDYKEKKRIRFVIVFSFLEKIHLAAEDVGVLG